MQTNYTPEVVKGLVCLAPLNPELKRNEESRAAASHRANQLMSGILLLNETVSQAEFLQNLKAVSPPKKSGVMLVIKITK